VTDVIASSAFAADGDRWTFRGELTFDDAMAVLDAAAALPLPKSGVVDLSGLAHADSAALAVLLALRRRTGDARFARARLRDRGPDSRLITWSRTRSR
jgi:ABC-type transporter Mla MlaB component